MAQMYSFSSPHPQLFPLPYTVLRYITITPSSSKSYQKLLQTCKHFYSKNPVIFIDWIIYNRTSDYGGWLTYSKNYIKIDFDIIPYKIWLTRLLGVDDRLPDRKVISKMLKKVFYCNLTRISVVQQEISYDEYKLLTAGGNVCHLEFRDVSVYCGGESLVPLENILERLPNIEQFICFFNDNDKSYITSETSKNLTKLPPFKKRVNLAFDGISDIFHPHNFCEFLEKNCGIFTVYFLSSIQENFRNEFKMKVEKAAKNPKKHVELLNGGPAQWIIHNRSQKNISLNLL